MPQHEIEVTWSVNYETQGPEDAEEMWLLLHGYQQRGSVVLEKLKPYCPDSVRLVAPDAPFPAPHQSAAGWRMGFAWYLFDPATQIYHVPMEPAVALLRAFVAGIRGRARRIRVIGYSQGGYLAPFAARALTNIVQAVGINCRFRDESLKEILPFPLDAVHGKRDALVDLARSMQSHGQLLKIGNTGRFVTVEQAGHGINDAIGTAFRSLTRA
ncbi:alpha/beta hydrolase [Acanthopleuribacter pedis]|uniref:Phospholipase/carboxylesterase/thioesterase domain-containing protein n=1 Tax=Acanthopleuribacter pedis TaxID=442870 RepID=A0A8J7QB10_9BACT|nr:hypothetical protein [Acanthopleuribacter pedis]MBO1320850.1 hypothetical protein [Acanthopleuribacter pedis]